MVDPNRNTNRLFEEECKITFANRFTEEDDDFMAYVRRPMPDPPIIENYCNSHHGGQRNHRPYSRQNKNWNWSDGGTRETEGGGYIDKRAGRNHYRSPYQRGGGNNDNGGTSSRNARGYGDNFRRHNASYEPRHQRDTSEYKPMNVRRDYGNFVSASKE